MAFTAVDLAIQEILQTDFVTDIATIHNSNVLLLKDKLEDLINNFEIDITNKTIGTDNAIESIKTDNLILQDDGFIFQTGTPNNIIAQLSQNVSNQSVLNVDILNIDTSIDVDTITANTITINDDLVVTDTATLGAVILESSLIESKENVTVLAEFDTVDTAVATLTLTNTSKNNIYVNIEAETNIGATQVFGFGGGTPFAPAMTKFALVIDFDATNPPAQNTSFNIVVSDITENSGNSSIITASNVFQQEITIEAGTNQSTTNPILLHSDFAGEGLTLGVNYSSADPLKSANRVFGSSVSFNYIIDGTSNDRLIINSAVGLDIY